jgi:hypothetical protein
LTDLQQQVITKVDAMSPKDLRMAGGREAAIELFSDQKPTTESDASIARGTIGQFRNVSQEAQGALTSIESEEKRRNLLEDRGVQETADAETDMVDRTRELSDKQAERDYKTSERIAKDKNALKTAREKQDNPKADFRTEQSFHQLQTKVSYMHKMIMFGLQQRQMLVRMSEREPRGSESIQYWNDL